MGYYTAYTLHVDKNEEAVGAYIAESDDTDLHYIFSDSDINDWFGNAKWYEHDDDMCKLSSKFPEVLFTLTGEGEETGDVWRKWYQNGTLVEEWRAPSYDIPVLPQYTRGVKE
jgi:hypothetical protein